VKVEQQWRWRRMQSWTYSGELINLVTMQWYLNNNRWKKVQTLQNKNSRKIWTL